MSLVLEELAYNPDVNELLAAQPDLTGADVQAFLFYAKAMTVTGEAGLLGSNLPRNSPLETHSDRPEADRNWPALGGCQGTISSSIGVDLPIPQKPTLATSR